MVVLHAATHLAAAVLVLSGLTKLRSPGPIRVSLRALGLPSSRTVARLLGGLELAIGAAALLAGSVVVTAALALAWVALTATAVRLWRAGDVDCGCFGASGTPVGPLHVAVDGLLALAVVGSLADPAESVARSVEGGPPAAVATVALLLAGAAATASVFSVAFGGGRRTRRPMPPRLAGS